MRFRCPNCNHPIEVEQGPAAPPDNQTISCPSCKSRFDFSSQESETVTVIPGEGMQIGHFSVRSILGEGAFGTVFEAFDTQLQRKVALKVPRADRVVAGSLQNLFKEARAASTIRHPNVIKVHEVGMHEDRPYIVIDFVDGTPLSRWSQDYTRSIKEIVAIMIDVCSGVQAAHDVGVTHRDIKPDNILVDADDNPHIADFGLAKRQSAVEMTVTQDGKIFGTPAYMSPEQASGDVKNVGPQSDQFSLGITLYELLVGERPFKASDFQTVMYRIRNDEPRSLRSVRKEIPRDLETICMKTLQKEPARRYASVSELAADLQKFVENRPITARPVGVFEKSARWAQRNRGYAAALLGTLLSLVLSVGLLSRKGSQVNVGPPKLKCEFSCILPDAYPANASEVNWSWAPLTPDRIPDYSQAGSAFGTSCELKIDLDPGEYLIVVEVPGVGFHEVYRTIPADNSDQPGFLLPLRFTWKGDTVVLPPINIIENGVATSSMILIPGGKLPTGASPLSEASVLEVDSFFLDPHEVTYDQYTQLNPEPAAYERSGLNRSGTYPVVGVHWYQAAQFAELSGKRLPTEWEWEYAAQAPSGSAPPDESSATQWGPFSVDDQHYDVTGFGVKFLCSNVAEITSSVLAPLPGQQMVPAARAEARNGFIYRGGPMSSEDGATHWGFGRLLVRRSTRQKYESGELLGFRCARSQKCKHLLAN